MSDFKFLQNPISKKWVILAPRRAKRPDVAKGFEPVCPFCPGREGNEEELYRVPAKKSEIRNPKSETNSNNQNTNDKKVSDLGNSNLDIVSSFDIRASNLRDSNWLVRVLPNKYPFAPIHELVIHTPEHGRNFDQLPKENIELILQTYKKRYLLHQDKGQVYIFHNRGEAAGESLPHAHTQIAVVPFEVKMDVPRLDPAANANFSPKPLEINSRQEELIVEIAVETTHFYLFCPKTSQWPDEVWVAPKKRGRAFGEIADAEISDLSFILPRLIRILDLRNGSEQLPFNFHIYPGGDWYLRFVPRLKSLGGFEVGTGIYINTQDPVETIKFIKEHFENPDEEKIKTVHQAEYSKHA